MELKFFVPFLLTVSVLVPFSYGQVLTPPYFNLAEGRRITATATCGENVDQPELYCKLVGADSDKPTNYNVIQGQLCDYCDPHDQNNRHPPQYAIDGSERWWQSPPLSRGVNYNQVNLTIDLGQLFQVAYVVIKMANSPRPGIWVLERSVDDGKSYTPWQYFADNDGDCERFFGIETLKSITEDDDVVCTTRFSKVVPLKGGEIFVSLLNERPSSKNFFNSSALQEFTRATNIRLKLLRTKTLLGHLMSVARQDHTVTRRYFYSIKDISIGGRCVCNGHASVCDITDPNDQYKLQCRCQHNTCGAQCETCCSGYIQKQWRPASYTEDFICERCNCHEHSNECTYDEQVDLEGKSLDIFGQYEGGGVCQNCRHHTEGLNCELCTSGYYKPYDRNLNDTDVCQSCQCRGHYYTGNCAEGSGQCECRKEFLPPYCDACNEGYYDYPHCKPCDCFKEGTINGVCEVGGGQCPCKENFVGLNCTSCAEGFYNFSSCEYCDCNLHGSFDTTCDVDSGHCHCSNNYGGRQCDRCDHGYFDYSNDCQFCDCDPSGTEEEICNKDSGECLCKSCYSGDRCDQSAPGCWGYPIPIPCDCDEIGASDSICHAVTGKCACRAGFSGRTCNVCGAGYYNYPDCQPCNCDGAGSIGISCDGEGKCQCKYNFEGVHCDRCREEFYNFPICEECNCDPAGVLETFAGCGNAPVGELCECKERVTGRICDQCRSIYWNLIQSNPLGCEDCKCSTPGTLGAMETCDMHIGQCNCKPHVSARQCDQCMDGTFNLMEDNLFGCSDCQCNIGGSVNNNCDKVTGQCQCRYRIEGQRCDKPMKSHYFPTLFQEKYEAEDGRTPQNTPVRFGYNELSFPNYSWRGYAVYSELQKETLHDVFISKPSLYRLIFYYMNPSLQPFQGKIVVTPENPLDERQEVDVTFQPTKNGPELFTVSTLNGFPLPFVLNPGVWTLSIQNSHPNLFIDYMVLLPLAYYEATILTEVVTSPCTIGRGESPCLHYAYPDVSEYNFLYGSAGYVDKEDVREPVEVYDDDQVLSYLDSPPMAWLSDNQKELRFDMRLREPGKHVLVINYFTPDGSKVTNVGVTSNTQTGIQQGRAVFYDCPYSWICRQAVQNLQGEVAVFDFDSNYVNVVVSIQGDTGNDIAINSLALIPLDKWTINHIKTKPICIRIGGECITTEYKYSPEAVKVEFEDNFKGKSAAVQPPGVSNSTTLVFLNGSDTLVDITGKLNSAGRYLFIVHYFQPKKTDFKMDSLLQNGQFFEATLPVPFCPDTSGCRAILTKLDGSDAFDILENFVLSLTLSGDNEVWLDYVLVIPYENFSPEMLRQRPRDKMEEFLDRCGKDSFNIDSSETGFCRESAFALTSSYNNGALFCQCNSQGAESFECELFGGQCPCRPNVIGRECNSCKTGHFGFPQCRPCDCPSTALCDPLTGECICPPRVVGGRCERCALNTFGFDPIIGCEECRCSEIGVYGGELQCNLNNGQCLCKDNVVGKRCEMCAAGYWSFPFCQLCDCDIRGTEPQICSQSDAQCHCKLNVEGRSCTRCKPGSFHLEESNPLGCTDCFCFGRTQQCSSSNLAWGIIEVNRSRSNGFDAVHVKVGESNLMTKKVSEMPIQYPNLALVNLTSYSNPLEEGFVYYSVPEDYMGNRVKSYGGEISYKILTISNNLEFDLTGEADLILKGNNYTALYFYGSTVKNGRMVSINAKLQERSFRTLSGVFLRRDQFMKMLYKLEGIYIRAQYDDAATEARVTDFTMETAVDIFQPYSRLASSVEQCTCPENYQGTSCEDIAEGYMKNEAGNSIRCVCNNHADYCDPNTGICHDCRDHTMGDECDQCVGGYFGDATQGTIFDCLICSCPMPTTSNNFAISCAPISNDDVVCECQGGYVGPKCGTCAPGFFGQPSIFGDYCKPCECNNNIDVTYRYGCDDISGRCLTCLNNTFGEHCERCEPWYYGDAVLLKNCDRCLCDECGSRECSHYTGLCDCHENVIGPNCDRCAPDFWGFASCQGCHACNCEEASENRQCDEETGQCFCKPGVTGQRCDRCKPGFWKYTEFGCTECACFAGFSIGVGCDPLTGHCSCLPGVIGDNCERCPDRWVLIEGRGCQECDDCVHALLDSTDNLGNLIYPVIEEYASAAQSFFLHQRLQVINGSVEELRPKVDAFDLDDEDLMPVDNALDKLYTKAIAVSAKAELLDDRATTSSSDGKALLNQANEVLNDIRDGQNLADAVIIEINKLSRGLETGIGAQTDLAINEAEAILEQMKKTNLTTDEVTADLEIAQEFLDRIRNISFTGQGNQDRVDESVDRLVELESKMNEMQKLISDSRATYNAVRAKNHKSRVYGIENLKKKYKDIKHLGEDAEMQIKDATNYTELARNKLGEAEQHYFVLESQLSSLIAASDNLNASVIENAHGYEDAILPSEEAINHAAELKYNADELDDMLSDTRFITENALSAANANENIVAAINNSMEAAQAAKNASEQALELSSGVYDQAIESLSSSEVKYGEAEAKISQVEDELIPNLVRAQDDVSELEDMNDFANNNIDGTNRLLDKLDPVSMEVASKNLQEEAVAIAEEAKAVNDKVKNQYANLQNYAGEARELSKNMEDAKRDTKLALAQVETVENLLPAMKETTRKFLKRKNAIDDRLKDVGDRLDRLKRTIKKTREGTNKIKVGIDFQPGDVLELKNPENLIDTSTSTDLSVFIKTKDEFGMPLFLGTPNGGSNNIPRTSTDDFMAIEVFEGYVKLTTNLGAGASVFINNQYVSDNKWYKIHIKRIGKTVKLTVSYEDENGEEVKSTVEKVLLGTFSILNLHPEESKLFIGGIPAGVEVDPSLETIYFSGQMEDLWLNNRPIGLWNFMSKGGAGYTIRGAKERLELKDSKMTSHIVRFDGTGYFAKSTKGHKTSPEVSILLNFKTYAEDGLLYLLKNGVDEYVSLELRGGKILYQHKFKEQMVTLLTDGMYNDDQWHLIDATRVKGDAVMKIDNGDFQTKRGDTFSDFSAVPEIQYFGGYPGNHPLEGVSNEDFRGCIEDVKISDITVDFAVSIDSIGTVPGCILEEISLVSFPEDDRGFVKLPNPEGIGLQLVFKFKTKSPDSLLFYTETSDKVIYMSLSLVDGALVLKSAPGGEISTGTYTKYNDDEWHIVIATRENNELRLDIDDFEKYSVELIQESLPFDGPVFFGGIPRYYTVSAAVASADFNFHGCIADATLNGKIIDFAFAPRNDRPGVLLGTCSLITRGDTAGTPDFEARYDEETESRYSTSPTFFTHSSTISESSTIETTAAPLQSCTLPIRPEEDTDVSKNDGLRFGSRRDSRMEYEELPGVLRGDFSLSVDFKTFASDGIIFYVANMNHRDFVTIYMNDGKIVFSFSPGRSTAIMRSIQRYNNNQWHKLFAHRTGNFGRLEVDGFIVANGSTSGQSKHIEENPPYYFGGLDNEIVELAKDNTESTLLSFNGCLNEFRMDNKLAGGQRKAVSLSECSNKVEPGVFFGVAKEGKMAHAVVRLKFNVGLTFDMSLDVKPRQNSGVLMSVHGRRDFILLQLRNGLVELKVDNGKGIITASLNLTDQFQICDGEWHSIQVVKNKHVLVLIVDGMHAPPAAGSLGASSADTNNPLFLGSQPRLKRRRGNAVEEKYVGCIRNVTVNNERIDLAYTLFVGEVNAGVCPLM